MPTSNINDEMRQTAEYARKVARERFGKELDYSESSLPILEYIIEQAYRQFHANRLEGKIPSDTALIRTASVWGSYFGELIREKLGGTWIIEESKRWILVNNFNISPIEYVYQRITAQLHVNVKDYFDDVVIKLSSEPISFVQPAPNLPNRSFTANQSQTESDKVIVQPQNINTYKKKIILNRKSFTDCPWGGIAIINNRSSNLVLLKPNIWSRKRKSYSASSKCTCYSTIS